MQTIMQNIQRTIQPQFSCEVITDLSYQLFILIA